MDNNKVLPGTVVIFFILYLLIFIVGNCFGESYEGILEYDHVYAQFYQRENCGFGSLQDVFDHVAYLAHTTYNYYDDDNKSMYSCPAYTLRLGGTCSSYAILFMALMEKQFGVTSTYLLVITNTAHDCHAVVEYRGVWYDPTRNLIGDAAHYYNNHVWYIFQRLDYDHMARRSASYMDGVHIWIDE